MPGVREEGVLIQDYGEAGNWCWDRLLDFIPINIAIKLFLIPFCMEEEASPI